MRCDLRGIAVRIPHGCCRRSAADRNREHGSYARDENESIHSWLPTLTDPRPRLARSEAWLVSPRSMSRPVLASTIISNTDPLGAAAPYGTGAYLSTRLTCLPFAFRLTCGLRGDICVNVLIDSNDELAAAVFGAVGGAVGWL
jgi:hypothetical protein